MDTTIRESREVDIPLLKAWFEKLHDYAESLDPIKRIRKMPGYVETYFTKFLKNITNNDGMIYIIESEGKPIGYIAGFVADKQSEENLLEVVPSQLGIISNVYLEPDYRGKKIGEKMLGTLEKYFAKKGCDAIWVDTNSFNTRAVGLYKSVGYMEREVGLMKKIK